MSLRVTLSGNTALAKAEYLDRADWELATKKEMYKEHHRAFSSARTKN